MGDRPAGPRGLTARALETWQHAGLACAIVPNTHLGFFNGYVQLPEDDPRRDRTYNALDGEVDVHGGLTYGPDKDGWVGFDTGHAGDHWAPDDLAGVLEESALRYFGASGIGKYVLIDRDPMQHLWTMDELRAEVNRLAEQLAERR